MLSKERATELLQKQLDLITEINQKPRFSMQWKKWYRDTEIIIEKIFGENSRHIKDFDNISYSIGIVTSSTPDSAFTKAFHRGLDSSKAVLESMIDEINTFVIGQIDVPKKDIDIEQIDAPKKDSITVINQICTRFHQIVRQLRSRYNDRSTLNIEDEHDVQDLLHALLLIEFDDIRREEFSPSHAGSGSRIDFLLKQEQIGIEVKKTREGLTPRELGNQISSDIERYRSHPDCLTLIFFIYDPEARIPNPSGIENDFSGDREGFNVRVIIAPKY